MHVTSCKEFYKDSGTFRSLIEKQTIIFVTNFTSELTNEGFILENI